MKNFDAFLSGTSDRYQAMFGKSGLRYDSIFADIAAPILSTLACGDAPYHNIDHTLKVVTTGQHLLHGKQKYEGSVSPSDWLHVLVALLCHDIGYVKGACEGDRLDLHQYADGNGSYVHLPAYATGAALREHHVERGKAYVAAHLSQSTYLDIARVQQNIELTRFPVPKHVGYQKASGYGSLCRAADLIGQFSDSQYLQKLSDLFDEFEETGMNQTLGYESPDELRAGYPDFYERKVYPYIWPSINYLGVTPDGRKLISRLYANILAA